MSERRYPIVFDVDELHNLRLAVERSVDEVPSPESDLLDRLEHLLDIAESLEPTTQEDN